jgi:excisionase family DNA binding protein
MNSHGPMNIGQQRPRGDPANAAPAALPDCYLPLKALAAYSGLGVRTLRDYLSNRMRPLPHYRVGGKILVRRSDFDAWVSQFRVASTPVSVDALVDDVVGSLG